MGIRTLHNMIVADVLKAEAQHRIVGVIDATLSKNTLVLSDLCVVGNEDDIHALIAKISVTGIIVAIGDPYVRFSVTQRLKERFPSLTFITTIHPSAIIGSDVQFGEGTVVMPGAIIHAQTRIGDGAIVNTKASLDHNCVLGDYAALAPGVTCSGNVTIGSFSWIGAGATISHGKCVGDHTVVGAGSCVVRDIGGSVVAFGLPAKKVRDRKPGDKFL